MKSLRLPCVCTLALAMSGAAAAQNVPSVAARPARLAPLPLTQLDDRAFASELDDPTLSLTFTEPILLRELLLQLVRGTSLSLVPGPDATGTFIGDLKNVSVRQALALVLPPFGLDYAIDGTFIRVFRRQADTRLFDINYLAAAPRAGNGDLFEDIAAGVRTLLSDAGSFNVDRHAGLLQVTDLPERLERVGLYLDAVHDRVHRQVQIDARVIEVELPAGASLEWGALASMATLRPGAVPELLAALSAQGTVTVLASPTVLVLNNQAALVRAALRTAFADDRAPREAGVALSVTPQAAADGMIILGVSPLVTTDASDGSEGPAATATREIVTVARVADGHTLVLAGLARDQSSRDARAGSGGWFGRAPSAARTRGELVILLTPSVVSSGGTR